MSILATKLYQPPPRPGRIARPRLIVRLNQGLVMGCKLTLISASAGFGKTTLISTWVAHCGRQAAWLSLDEGDSDPARFSSYLIAALQTIKAGIGEGLLAALQSPEPPQIEAVLTTLLNEIATLPDNFVLVLDDYHLADAPEVDRALAFIIEHQPPHMHLVIATREDPSMPLARLRVRGHLIELRTSDLRFTPAEAAEFLNQVMGLNLSAEDIAALETRVEGWIAGLQLAALAMQGLSMKGHQDTAGFIQAFTGSHHFVMDYLLEEVLRQQSENTQVFLLRTAILDRMCGPLCEAVLLDSSMSGQATLEYLEHANLFIIPLDNERGWYRYHHLFGDLLRKRLGQSLTPEGIAELHIRASEWYEDHALLLEAFRHAATANDIERAERLMESKGMPLHLPGPATVILNWLEALPRTVLDARPALWWKQASLLLGIGQTTGVEERLSAAEKALNAIAVPGAEPDDIRDLIGKIAIARATLAMNQFQIETIQTQARRALECLAPDNLSYRSTALLTLGFAYYLQEDRDAAGRAYAEALSLAQAGGDKANTILASLRLGLIQFHNNHLYQAAKTYQQVLKLIGEYSPSNSAVACISLARIYYEWNDLKATEKYLEQSSQLAQQYDHVIDRIILSDLYLARLKLARGDVSGAARIVAQAEQTVRQKNIRIRLQDLTYIQAWIHLRQGDFDAVIQMARQNDLRLMKARALIAQNNPSAALKVIESPRQEVEAKGWSDRLLEVKAVQSIALYANGDKEKAMDLLGEVLVQAEPEGFVRLFVDEGPRMAELLTRMKDESGRMKEYIHKLLAAFGDEKEIHPFDTAQDRSSSELYTTPSPQPLIDPLTPRELEVLNLIAEGHSNQEIGVRLFLALDTVKGHNRRIFDKLQVQRRTEAIARARELGLI